MSAALGRARGVGLADSGHAVIEPVIYRMLDHDVGVQVGPGSMLDAADQRLIIARAISGRHIQ